MGGGRKRGTGKCWREGSTEEGVREGGSEGLQVLGPVRGIIEKDEKK